MSKENSRRKIKLIGITDEMVSEIKWMCQYAKRYWFVILFYSLAGVLGTVLSLISSLMTKRLIDIVTGYDTGAIWWAASIMFGMGTGSIIINSITSRISAHFSVKVQNEIQAEIYDKIMESDWESLYEFRSGDLLNRLNGDVTNVATCIISWLPNLLTKLVQFLGALFIILYYDPIMAVIALIGAPASFLSSKYMIKKMRKYNKKLRTATSDLYDFEEESFQNLQSIKAFNIIGRFEDEMRNVQHKYRTLSLEYNKVSVIANGIMSFVGMIVSYACIGWSVYRLWTGKIVYGTMTLFLQQASNLSTAFSGIIALMPQAISAMTGAGRIMEVVTLPKEREGNPEEMEEMLKCYKTEGLELSVENAGFMYRDGNRVLSDVSMNVSQGKIVALVGPSGEGKTTLVRMFLGLINPTEGNIKLRVPGKIECDAASDTRAMFSYVPQGNTIFAGTIEDNMRMVKQDATEEEIEEALRAACAWNFVKKMPQGVKSQIKERAKGISEGQAQRLSIARALLRDAPIVLFDEATSALDIDTEKAVLNNVLKYNSNKICIVTTHRPSVLQMCDNVYKINETSLVELSKEEISKMIVQEGKDEN